jgi:acyl carrier protein
VTIQNQFNDNFDVHQLTETERIVSGIWSEVLQQDKINPEDNFFELGGDSLMTMMVLFRVNDDLHVELPPGAIMEAPTLREFCKMIDNQMKIIITGDFPDEEIDSMEVESGVI